MKNQCQINDVDCSITVELAEVIDAQENNPKLFDRMKDCILQGAIREIIHQLFELILELIFK